MWHKFKQINYKYHLLCGLLIRFIVIQYGNYHDENYSVPFTDIDYKVFTDAGRHILNNTSPFNRHTYRYSPIIAILSIPNILVHCSFGKILFSIIDLIVALCIRFIVKNSIKEYENYKQKPECRTIKNEGKLTMRSLLAEKQLGKKHGSRNRRKDKTLDIKKSEIDIIGDISMLVWLYNPMTIAIATRGNCDSIAGLIVLVTLYILQFKKRPFLAGLVHGLAVHIRLYPIAYSLAYFMYLSKYSFYSSNHYIQNTTDAISDSKIKIRTNSCDQNLVRERKGLNKTNSNKQIVKEHREVKVSENDSGIITTYHKKARKTIFQLEYFFYLIPNYEQFKLVSGCLLSLSFWTGVFYYVYGYQFLFESYIYHLLRKDTRHNFSLYFYVQYLTAGIKNIGIWQNVLIALPQIILLVVFSVRYGLNKLSLNFAVLTITIVMVSYNTVLTSQYFVWILSVLPLCIWQIHMSKKHALYLIVIWFSAQIAWLLPAYFLEFQGHNTFMFIWIQSVSFFCANMAILGRIIRCFMPIKNKTSN